MNSINSGAYLGEKGMRFNSAAAPATVIEDEPFNATRKGKGKGRKIHEPGDLPEF